MNRKRRMTALLMSVFLVLTALPFPVYAEQGMIRITSDWQGSVFGDVGGQDKITADNFEITETDGAVVLRSSNDRGKIASSSEGIAYYYRDIPANADFELSATAHVDEWKANNQVAFGLMLRSNVLDNEHQGSSFTGDFVAVGALDQVMKSFYKQSGKLEKSGLEFESASAPAAGQAYELSVKKSGSNYTVRIGDEIRVIDNFAGSVAYAGLFTSRNVKVTYTNVSFHVTEAPVELGDWEFSAFGSNTNAERNPAPDITADGTVTLAAKGGKIDSKSEGISYYYKKLPAGSNVEIRVKAAVESFNENSSIGSPGQKSFGLMLKDEAADPSDFIAIGAIDTAMKGFYRLGGTLEKGKLNRLDGVNAPAAGQVYDLKLKKTGDAYVLTVNGQSQSLVLDSLMNDEFYAGFYVARDAKVTFSQYEVYADGRKPERLKVDAASAKTKYLQGESLDLTGLNVYAVYAGGREELLSEADYVVSGFDGNRIGTHPLTVHFNGATQTVDLTVEPLTVTQLDIRYFPAKTEYYIGDRFNPEGLTVIAEYNDGFKIQQLKKEQYTIDVDGAQETASGFRFRTGGTKTVTVTSRETPTVTASFDVVVKPAAITGLEVRQKPAQTVYYVADRTLNIDGLVVYARYSDGSDVRLARGEYSVSSLDTSAPGDKQLVIMHKGKQATVDVTVKEKELTGIRVTKYPGTTYEVGEEFDSAGLEVTKVYDNGDTEVLAASEYEVDASGYDKTKAGAYAVRIVPTDGAIAPATLNVTVREPVEYVWKAIRFGQSTSDAKNTAAVIADGKDVDLTALEGGGKVTGDHDGITFYYTEIDAAKDNFVLSADIHVREYAKNPHDGQESFGIMARDAIGTPGTSSVFASNIAAIGGYSGGTRNDNGTQLFVRTGVESPDGAGSQGIQRVMLHNEKPGADNTPYKLTLAKTNSGFTGKIGDGEEAVIFEPDILGVQDGKAYIGFYTARLATIEVRNIELTVTAAESDPPKVERPKQPVAPEISIVSPDSTSETDYALRMKSNVNGTVTVKRGTEVIARDETVEAGNMFVLPAAILEQADTNFTVVFLPSDTDHLTSYSRIIRNFTVTMKTYVPDGDIYVSPDGASDGTGTANHPLDLDTALRFVKPGQKIVLQDGRYVRSSRVNIAKYNDGKPDAMKYLVAAPGARPVIDFDKKSEGVVLSGDYWHIVGIDFARSAPNTRGFTIGGDHNIVENSRFYEHGDTGLQISRTDDANDMSEWPSYNLVLNCTSFDNRDPSDNNADGFAAKLTSGVGNVFRGSIAHNNIDDGWDLYTKAGSGAIGAVLIEDSIAYHNGTLTDGTVGKGDKNGFKLGGEGIHVPHIIRGSIAFGNGAAGFTSNSNPGVIAENNIAFNNVGGNLVFTTYSGIATDFTIDGFISYQKDYTTKDQYPSELNADHNFMFNGTESVNKSGVKLTDANFVSLEAVEPRRDEEGNIVIGDFLKFIAP